MNDSGSGSVFTNGMKAPAYLLLFACLLPGCATRSTAPNPEAGAKIGAAVTAPLEDLDLVRTKIPPVLLQAREAPYRHPADAACRSNETEVTALDEALGPDLDTQRTAADQDLLHRGGALVGESAIDALRSTTEGVLPFRGRVRKLSGAERHSREVASAIAAGIVRRACLEGLGEAHDCPVPAAPLPPATAQGQQPAGPDATGP